ncbi:MAG: cytochrome P450 [Actinomycetia bacterium]|nr:cytochrome P450 [Actinomycetes bacterium]
MKALSKLRPAPQVAPGPNGPAMLRNLRQILGDPTPFLQQCARDYGDVVQFPNPGRPTFLLAGEDLVKQVLMDAPRYGKDTPQYQSLSLVTGEGLLSADTALWKGQRKRVQPAFHHRSIRNVIHITQAEARVTAERWMQAGPPCFVDAGAAMSDVALRVVGRSLFGANLTGSSADLAAATEDALTAVVQAARVPTGIRDWAPYPAKRSLATALTELDNAVDLMLAQAEAGKLDTEESTGFLPILMDNTEVQGTELRDQIVTFLVAGHETVASALTWALYHISLDRNLQGRLQHEAQRYYGSGDIAELNLAGDTVAEALRMYPPAWLITRRSLVETELAGVTIPAGSLLILSPFVLGRDDRYWPEPERFDPDREIPRQPTGAYFPFGLGSRLCIGRDMALLEAKIVIAELVGRFWLGPPRTGHGRGTTVPISAGVTMHPRDGLRLSIRRVMRSAAAEQK